MNPTSHNHLNSHRNSPLRHRQGQSSGMAPGSRFYVREPCYLQHDGYVRWPLGLRELHQLKHEDQLFGAHPLVVHHEIAARRLQKA